MRNRRQRSFIAMDTVVTLTVASAQPELAVHEAMDRAFHAFRAVEQVCNRFDPQSEVRGISARAGQAVPISALLFEAVRFALTMAEATEGAFDPTVGRRLEALGFNRNYRSGAVSDSGLGADELASYRDVVLDPEARTILLRRPLLLDLGAVAKGLAVDLAARELAAFEGYIVEAGGDLFAGGHNEADEPWRVGIQHPLLRDETIATLLVSDASVCTSGTYERRSPVEAEASHLVDPRSASRRPDLLSCTVVAPFAMLADALSTAAFVLGPQEGLTFLAESGAEGLLIDPNLQMHQTQGMKRYHYNDSPGLP